MSRILITGSTDGLGRLAAESLHRQGHTIVVHARNADRAEQLRPLIDDGATLVVGDFADRGAVRSVAAELLEQEPLDAIIHNAGVSSSPQVMPVNVVAPYLLTALLPLPARLVYLSSGSHFGGQPRLDGVDWLGEHAGSYSDSKLYVSALAATVARLHPEVLSNSVDPGWVPTRMGGAGATDRRRRLSGPAPRCAGGRDRGSHHVMHPSRPLRGVVRLTTVRPALPDPPASTLTQ